MRTWLMTVMVGATLAGCATSHKSARSATVRVNRDGDNEMATAKDAPTPQELGGASVKIVARRPSASRYKFVGRVEATATTVNIVDAAVAADADLRRQAKALGADVVQLDTIAPPRDDARPRRRVILAGRAYKSVVAN